MRQSAHPPSSRRRASLARLVLGSSWLVLLGPVLLPPAMAGEPVLDQCTVVPGDPIGVAAGVGDSEVAQTFTVGATGTLSSLHLWIRRYRDDEDLILELLPTLSGAPATDPASALARFVLPALEVPPFARSDELTPVDVKELRIHVERGEVLAVSLRTAQRPPAGLGFSWDGRRSDYEGGAAFWRPRGGSAWKTSSRPEYDLGLKTFVEPWKICPYAPSLIAQDAPILEPGHVTDALFANAVEAVTVSTRPGHVGSTWIHAAFVSDLPADLGIQGWIIVAAMRGDVAIVEVTTDGTALAPWPDGLRRNGFERTLLDPEPRSPTCTQSAVVSGAVLALEQPVVLPPHGTATVLSLRVEALAPQGPDSIEGTLEWPSDCCNWGCRASACGQPCSTSVTSGGASQFICEKRGAEVRFVADETMAFRRGDSNGDGRVDISDGIRTLMFLFLGAGEPPCSDAADTTDDGKIDMSDSLAIFNDFFRSDAGTGIPPPGPFLCGRDPSPDRLLCADSILCE